MDCAQYANNAIKNMHIQRDRKYRINNREKIRQRRYNNINHRLAHNMRARLKDVLKGTGKSEKTMEIVGCSIEQLKKHLEQ